MANPERNWFGGRFDGEDDWDGGGGSGCPPGPCGLGGLCLLAGGGGGRGPLLGGGGPSRDRKEFKEGGGLLGLSELGFPDSGGGNSTFSN